MSTVSTKEMLEEHLPYRLTLLDGLCWACEIILPGEDPRIVQVTLDGKPKLVLRSVRVLTNSLVEAGLLYCRVLLNFLGIRFDGDTNQLAEIKNPGSGDNFSIRRLGLPCVRLQDLRSAPTGSPQEVEESCRLTLLAMNKGVAHFTDSITTSSQVEDALRCARTVMWLTEEYVYRRPGRPVPSFKSWTAA